MKVCFSTLGCVDYPLEKSLALSTSLGYEYIELRGVGGTVDNRNIPDFQPSKVAETLEKFKKYKVKPIVLGTSCTFHDRKNHKAALDEGFACANIAKSIDCPYIRIFGNDRKSDSAERSVIDGISALCDLAKTQNVTVLLEIHGDYNRIETVKPITDALSGYDNFGLIWDIAHSDRYYMDNWRRFCDSILPLIRHVHIKDHVRIPIVGEDPLKLPGDGDIPIPDIIKYLNSVGYDGCFSLEWERAWHPALPPIETALNRYNTILQNL